jgi:L-rhamnose mutarotase
LHRYSIKFASFNFAAAWKEMKTTTLTNRWTKLLQDMEPENDFKGFKTSNFHEIMKGTGDRG